MFSLLRRDPVMGAPSMAWGGVIALNAGVLGGLITTLAAGSRAWVLGPAGGPVFLTTLAWFSISLFLFWGKARERCQPIDMVLPISARRLWLSHVTALTLLGLLFLVLTAGALAVPFWAFRESPLDFSALKQALADLIVPISVSLILVVVLLQSPKPSLYRIPGSRKYLFYSILSVGSASGLILVLLALPPLAALIPLVFALLLGYRTYRTVPAAFTILPSDPDPAEAPVAHDRPVAAAGPMLTRDREYFAATGAMTGVGFGWFLFRLLLIHPKRNAFAGIFYFPLFLLWGFFLSGFMTAWRDMDLPQFSYAILTGFLLLSPLPAQASRLPLLDPLPVSRKLLFAALMLPHLTAIIIGLGGGRVGATLIEGSKLLIKYQAADSGYFPPYRTKFPMIRVPGQYCEIAWDGQAPASVSPWGESHPAWAYPLYRGSRIMVYSPFNTPEGCSPRFAALQISRAIQAVYGKSVPYQEILDRYLKANEGGSVELKNGGSLLFERYPDLNAQGVTALFQVLMIAIGVSWLLMAAVFLRACRATVTHARRMGVYYGMAAVAMASVIGQVAVMVSGLVRADVGAAFLQILTRDLANALPGGNPAAWLLCTLFMLAAYWLAQTQFERIEVLPGRPCR